MTFSTGGRKLLSTTTVTISSRSVTKTFSVTSATSVAAAAKFWFIVEAPASSSTFEAAAWFKCIHYPEQCH
jgi:hypothetical protein